MKTLRKNVTKVRDNQECMDEPRAGEPTQCRRKTRVFQGRCREGTLENGADMEFWDDMKYWKLLTWDVVMKARKLEMVFFRQIGRVPESTTGEMAGQNQVDESRPNYRSRLVGREVKQVKKVGGLELHRIAVIDIQRAYISARTPIFFEIPREAC